MIDQNELKFNMRNTFFELISNIAEYSYGQILEIVSLQMQDLLQVRFAAIYTYNYWEQAYDRVTGDIHNILKKQPFKEFNLEKLMQQDEQCADLVFEKSSNLKSRIIFLNPKIDPGAFLFLAYPRNYDIDPAVLELSKDEMENLLNIFNYYNFTKENQFRNAYLVDLTTKFYSLITKKNILTEMTKAIDTIYPQFEYNILLSQDYEEEPNLPIKTLEYSDDATKRVSNQAFITGEIQLEDRVKEKKTCLYAPLKGKQGVYGVLQIITRNTVDFPQNEIKFIAKLAGAAGQAIESATLYQNSNHLVKDLKLLNDATHALNSNLNIVEITTIVRKKIMEACGAEQVGFIFTGETQSHMINVLSGSTEYFYTSQGEDNADFILNQVMQKNEPLFSGDYSKELSNFPFLSVMAIPMLQAGMIHGVIIIIQKKKYAFTFDNFKLMQSLVQHFTLSLTNSILNEKLKAVAITDYLTKLYSRNYLEEKIQQHLITDEKGALIIVDIDDFKNINDTYGHDVGDEVIIQVASIITAHTGEDDVPARWGGEELAIYLANATIDDGVHIATQIRKQTENFTSPKVTISSGIATWEAKRKTNVKDLFVRADKALYAAKNTGKNCVVKEIISNLV